MSKEDNFNEVDEFVIKANDKIISSKLLIEGGQYATSVSAAYYAMFLTVKALLIKKNYYPKTHSGLISKFGQLYVNEGDFNKEIAKYPFYCSIFTIKCGL